MGEVRSFDHGDFSAKEREGMCVAAVENQIQRTALSFEVSPPKTDVGMAALCGRGGVLDQLSALEPEKIACTYHPGGANVGKNLQVLTKLVRDGKTTPLTHFTCAGNTREGIRAQLQTYLDHGICHLFAQQGDVGAGRGGYGQLQYASELVTLVRDLYGSSFTIAVAGAPEGRRCLEEDIELLMRKQDAGADAIITRPFWDFDRFQRWLEAVLAANIRLPVAVGVMPVLDLAETVRMTMAPGGASLPRELTELISRNWIYPNPFVKDPFDSEAEGKNASFKAAGIDYTIRQIESCCHCGIQGIHLHTRNRYEDVAGIVKTAGLR